MQVRLVKVPESLETQQQLKISIYTAVTVNNQEKLCYSSINISPHYQDNFAAVVKIKMQLFYMKSRQHRIKYQVNNTQNLTSDST